jgi:hypothetical protein
VVVKLSVVEERWEELLLEGLLGQSDLHRHVEHANRHCLKSEQRGVVAVVHHHANHHCS